MALVQPSRPVLQRPGPHLTGRHQAPAGAADLDGGAEAERRAASLIIWLITLAPPSPCAAQTLLTQTAVLKLNGGLGTSMGLEKAKSLLVVKDGGWQGAAVCLLALAAAAAAGRKLSRCRSLAQLSPQNPVCELRHLFLVEIVRI